MINLLKSNHGDTFSTVIVVGGIILVVTIMTILGISMKSDDVAQQDTVIAITDFVNKCAEEGKITRSNYDVFTSKLKATNHTYKIDIEVKHLDENIGNKSSWTQSSVVGENKYYSVYTSTIMESIDATTPVPYNMKEGDIIAVSVKNTDTSITQSITSAFLAGTGNGTAVVSASGSATVKTNG